MNTTGQNHHISRKVLLCAVILHWLNLAGLAQPTDTNQVLALNGTSASVTIPSAPSLQNPSAITVEAWIYPNLLPTGDLGDTSWFIGKSDGQNNSSQRTYEITWAKNDAQLGGGEGIGVNLFLNTDTWAFLGAILPESNWVHVAFTYHSANGLFQLFTNGVLASATTTDASGTIPLAGQLLRQTTLPLNLGGQTISEGALFAAGYMDEVRIWNTNLTANEIQGTEFCRLTGDEPNLAAYWNFDATNANDLTGNGNNGTLEGGAVIVLIQGQDVPHQGVCGTPYIDITQPESQLSFAGSNVSFTVSATGFGPFYYQWQFNDTNISGATSSTLAVTNIAQCDLGSYAVVVSNAFGAVTSSNAVLSMYPFLATPFAGLDTYWGYTNTLSVQAWGTGPLDYQWYDDGNAIDGATNETLTLTSIQLTNSGLYSVVVSNALGSVTNNPEQVVVNPAGVSFGGLYPSIIIQGVAGYNYSIESTSNLSDTNSWVTVTNLTLTQPIQLWIDSNIDASLPANPQRFYRVLAGQ
jgi:hypothetical protein